MADRWTDEGERRMRDRQERERLTRDRDGRGLGRSRGPAEYRSFDGQRGGYGGGFDFRDAHGRPDERGGISGRPGWQDRHYGGSSPGLRDQGYDDSHRAGRFQGRGGRRDVGNPSYGSGFAPSYGPDYGDFGDYGRHEPQRSARFDDDAGYQRNPPSVTGGKGGYDYERSYGEGGFDDREDSFMYRAGRKVRAWFDKVDGDSHRGRGPQGYKRSDERIADDAHERLTDDHFVDASNVQVAVTGGEVTLSGTVDSREAKHRAEQLVEDITGVHHVQNNLRVQDGFSYGASPFGATGPGATASGSILDAQARGEDRGTGPLGGGDAENAHGRKSN